MSGLGSMLLYQEYYNVSVLKMENMHSNSK